MVHHIVDVCGCELSTCHNSSTGRSFAFPEENARHWRENRQDRQVMANGYKWLCKGQIHQCPSGFSCSEPRHHITIVYRDGLTTALNLRPFLRIIGIPQGPGSGSDAPPKSLKITKGGLRWNLSESHVTRMSLPLTRKHEKTGSPQYHKISLYTVLSSTCSTGMDGLGDNQHPLETQQWLTGSERYVCGRFSSAQPCLPATLINPDTPQQESEGASKSNSVSSWRPLIRLGSSTLKTIFRFAVGSLVSKLRLFDIASIGFSPHVSSRVDWLTLASNRGNVKHCWAVFKKHTKMFHTSLYSGRRWPLIRYKSEMIPSIWILVEWY